MPETVSNLVFWIQFFIHKQAALSFSCVIIRNILLPLTTQNFCNVQSAYNGCLTWGAVHKATYTFLQLFVKSYIRDELPLKSQKLSNIAILTRRLLGIWTARLWKCKVCCQKCNPTDDRPSSASTIMLLVLFLVPNNCSRKCLCSFLALSTALGSTDRQISLRHQMSAKYMFQCSQSIYCRQ